MQAWGFACKFGLDGLKYLFLDEIQNVKGFEESINAYREEGEYSIFITGSNSYLLSGELATKLTGRYIEYELLTFSFDEYLGMKRMIGKEISTNPEEEFDNYLLEGGFPYAVRFDLSFYFATNTDNRIEYGPVLENIVYNYAKSRGYSVSVGRIGKLEVDFILRDANRDFFYVQVARYIDNGNVDEKGMNLTEEREYRPLERIRDSFPKYVMTLDRLLQKRSGIHHKNIITFIENGEMF